MKTNKDELLHETLVRYYWRLVCNGTKALADSARLHPMVVVLGTIAIIYMFKVRIISHRTVRHGSRTMRSAARMHLWPGMPA